MRTTAESPDPQVRQEPLESPADRTELGRGLPVLDAVKPLSRRRFFDLGDFRNDLAVPLRGQDLERILPHRDPFLFLDRIEFVSLEARLLRATRRLDPADPVFAGHFPGNPIYPGVLQGEMIFQACLALLFFVKQEATTLPEGQAPLSAVATGVEEMTLLDPLAPGDTVTIDVGLHDYDTLLATGIGQIAVGDRICTHGAGHFYVT